MAIFKILKGDSSRISISVTPFVEGYAYFTPDDGGFYIDAEVNGEQKRIRVNPNSSGSVKPVEATLRSSAWTSGVQTLTIPGVTKDTNGIIGLSQNVTDSQMEAARNAGMFVSGQDTDSITVAVFGDTPAIDIPVVAILLY